jgi:ATP/maltotriose-dependent transcriptional regulator MalT
VQAHFGAHVGQPARQWRLLWLERGALVTWATLDAHDAPIRFARVLAQAMRTASGRSSFDRIALEYRDDPQRALDALTAVLSEIASLAAPTVIMLDDGEHLPQQTARDALTYLLLNAPANLTVVLGTRASLALPTIELTARGDCARVTIDDLRLDLHGGTGCVLCRGLCGSHRPDSGHHGALAAASGLRGRSCSSAGLLQHLRGGGRGQR